MSQPVFEFLRQQRNGLLVDEIAAELARLVTAVETEKRGGELVIKISVKPAERGAEALVVSDEVVCRPPKPRRGVSVFYIAADKRLVRNDPRQQTMELREVPPQAPLRTLDTPATNLAAVLDQQVPA
jgi:hypothetical protein